MSASEVIVVGGGLAGLCAARDLADAGRDVCVLEARSRVGGRGYSVELEGRVAELGGSWFTSEHHAVRAELERYGLAIHAFPAVRHARWRTGGELRRGLPVPWEELGALERALTRLAADVQRYAAGDESAGAGSAAAYFDALDPPRATRDLLVGWWQLMAGAPPDVAAVSEWLGAIAAEGGLTGLLTCLAFAPVSGWSALADALAGTDGITLRLTAPVGLVEHDEDGVAVTTAGGDRIEAAVAVVAVPLNCLSGIEFEPALPRPIRDAVGRNVGCATKLVLLARGAPAHGIAVGHDPALPLRWWHAADTVDELTLLTAFGWREDGFDPDDAAAVRRALAGYFPEAELVSYAWHDWNRDPYSLGTWLTVPADAPEVIDPARFKPAGRIVFAGSDVAAEAAGWFEGALRSGAAAARDVDAMLGVPRHSLGVETT